MTDTKPFLLRAAEIAQREQPFSHPWNPKSEAMGVQLSRALALERTGVSIARIPPGKESFVYHSHRHEEEWLYILAGRGVAEIDGEEFEVGSGRHQVGMCRNSSWLVGGIPGGGWFRRLGRALILDQRLGQT